MLVDDYPLDSVQFVLSKPPVACQQNWLEPELGDESLALDMDMGRLSLVRTEEDEGIGTDLMDGWHSFGMVRQERMLADIEDILAGCRTPVKAGVGRLRLDTLARIFL